MKLERLEKQWEKLLNALSEFAAALKNAQTNSGPVLSESDIQYMRLIEKIDQNLLHMRRSVYGIKEKITQLK